jgi:hypothetical protein
MRKLVSALAISAGLVLLAIPAHAQDYPPTTEEGLTVSESTLSPGESFVVSGEGADPGATVVFTLTRTSSTLGSGARPVAAGPALARAVASVRPLAQGTTTLGSTTADEDGNFRATLTIPSSLDPGVYTLTATSGGEVLSTATIRVLASTTGGLAFTGSNVGPGLAIGAGLIVAGGLLLLAVRRRRRSTV